MQTAIPQVLGTAQAFWQIVIASRSTAWQS